MSKYTAALFALVLGALAALTGCSDTHGSDGEFGVVVGRDRDSRYSPATKTTTWDYDLTVKVPSGSTYDIDVGSAVYDGCYVGSKYPACVKN